MGEIVVVRFFFFVGYISHSLGLHYGLPWKTCDFNIITLFLRTIYVFFLHSGGPFKQFGLHQNFFLVVQVGRTTPGVIIFPIIFPLVFKFSLIFINMQMG